MDNGKRTSKDESGLVSEASATYLYVPAPAEIESAAQEKIEDPELLYRSLVRALTRRKGFGILFLQCTPAKGSEIFRQLEKDLHSKSIGRLTLTEPINNLFTLVRDREDIDDINVLFIEGIEKSLSPYIKSETGRNDYYKLEVLPPILANVNRLRDNFREQFPHVCFVFVVPSFALKYFMYRAMDFFSWHSGIWRFTTERWQLSQETSKALGEEYVKYMGFSESERTQKIAELQDLIDDSNQLSDWRANLYVEQGWVYIAAHDFEVALRCAKEAIKISRENYRAWHLKGNALDNLGRYEEAITAYDAALRIKPDDHEVFINKGSALDNLGRYEEAITAYDAALRIKPDNHEVLNNKGVSLGNLRRYEEAITAFDAALRIKPDDYGAFYNKGIALDDLERYEEAITAYGAAIRIKPDKHEALINKGVSLSNLGRYEEAITAYDAAIRIKPDKHEALINKGVSLSNLGRYEEAVTAYDAAIRIKPDKHEALINKGIALDDLGRYEEAITAFDAAIRIKPDNYDALDSKGVSLGNLGRYEEAITAFDQSLSISPDNANPWYNKACYYTLSHHTDGALHCLQKAIELDGTDEYIELAKTDTAFDSIRNNPQFQALLTKGNSSP